MQAILSKLPAFMLPFVTRSLRGGRGKRYLIFSLLLASMTGILGLWLTLGNGQFEQELRTELDLERNEWQLERETFTVYVHDPYERRDAEAELARLQSARASQSLSDYDRFGEVTELYFSGQDLLGYAARSRAYGPKQVRLRSAAQALVPFPDYGYDAQSTPEHPDFGYDDFPWHDPSQVAQLEATIAAKGMPAIADYRSPLSLGEALGFTGFLAGLFLTALGTVFAPLLVAVQQAQERHENTLMPLSGTALSPRELALGLASGPGAIIAIFAAPLLVVFLLCSTIAGEFAVAAALLAALATTTVMLCFGAQLLGQLIGHKRTPGVVGISLMGLAGTAWLVSVSIVASAPTDVAGFSAVVPQIGLAALLAEVFVDLRPGFSWVFVGTFAWTLGAVVLASLTLTALARKIEGRSGALLSVGQAGLGAVICMGLVSIAFPDLGHGGDEGVRQYLGLAMLALPLSLLFMARVPAGDGPPRMRSLDLPRLLLEFSGWAAAYFVASGLLFGTEAEAFHPVALAWLGWCVVVVGLLCVRTVATPTNVAGNLWAGLCLFAVFIGFVHAAMWGLDGADDLDEVFVLAKLSPVLGLVQVALTVWIPISLVRHLRKSLGSLTGTAVKPERS